MPGCGGFFWTVFLASGGQHVESTDGVGCPDVECPEAGRCVEYGGPVQRDRLQQQQEQQQQVGLRLA